MNIYIYNCSNTFNYGSMMMGENFVSYFNKILKEKNNYYVETNDELNIKRLKEATGIDEIFPVKMNSLFKDGLNRYDYIFGYLGFRKIISKLANNIDLVVVLGGDDFTEDYGWKEPVLNAIRFNILKREGIKVVMLGQTMGPYKSFRKPVMKTLLNNIDKIYPRDPITYKYLNNLGLKNIEITDDLALLPLSKQALIERKKTFITYCPSELIYRYSKEGKREEWIDFNLFMINEIMEKYPEKKLVLLAHVLKPEHVDDRIIVDELYELINSKYNGRVIIQNEEMYPFEVRRYIQQSLFTISSRMHPIVSSIQCEIPAIALSYSTKYWGIIGERYGLNDYIIDIRHMNYIELRDKFKQTVEKVEKDYFEIQAKMREKNKLAEETIRNTLLEIKSLKD
ncbi:colanic acid/amylovoran biosynthesis protein [Bacillus sp. SLBN-46]|uniref:polysaccharide pyruvyl transferase family protein n=1 Tax=Bacillus sp. SLBN-46 TaxID=3042283 RepID=UPI002855C4B2|nr:polysaccharide pyruvyl transferase family protein [Bacillus sp. SLBN-46]MDR6121165.1 colanic acid/amylovoran biosynthesis protein [Bacillus sp. SLBN-46]